MVWKRAGYGSSKKSETITISMRTWQEQGCRLILGAADFCFMKTREEKEKNDGFSV